MTSFRLATATDDALLRSLLRSNGMPTWVEMSIEREPSFFAGHGLGGEEWAVICEDGTEAVGMYTGAVLPVHVAGQPERLGYLGGLRVNPHYRNRIRIIRGGYASIEPLAPADRTLPWWFTVVAAGNLPARRLLEAGLRGLPEYRPLGDYVTFGLATSRGRRRGFWRRCNAADVEELIAFHNRQAARLDLAPVLDAAAVYRIGVGNFLLHARNGEIAAVAALWDQRAFKQIVARRYRRPLGALVPAYNLYARLCGRMILPQAGQALQQTFIAYFALRDDLLTDGRALLQDLLARCRTPVASIGLHANHPLVRALDGFRPMRYPARVYAVSFAGTAPPGFPAAQPEAALL